MNVREWALPVYTILIQMAVGMLLVLWTLRLFGNKRYGKERIDQIVRDPLIIIIATIILGVIGAHFHLSRPYLSFLAVRNFRTSWLSSRNRIYFVILSLHSRPRVPPMATKGTLGIENRFGLAGDFLRIRDRVLHGQNLSFTNPSGLGYA